MSIVPGTGAPHTRQATEKSCIRPVLVAVGAVFHSIRDWEEMSPAKRQGTLKSGMVQLLPNLLSILFLVLGDHRCFSSVVMNGYVSLILSFLKEFQVPTEWNMCQEHCAYSQLPDKVCHRGTG